MTFEMTISILAVGIALLSVVYARHAAGEAKQANRIALHGRKLDIFNTFKKFHGDLIVVGEANFREADAYRLINACDDAKFYFPDSLASDLKKYGDAAYELFIVRDSEKRQEAFHGGATREKINEVFAKKDRCDEIAKGLRERIEAELKVLDE
jgi:hypothetical protein